MRIKELIKPGIKVKRWLFFGIFGILLIAFGFTELVTHRVYDLYYRIFYVLLNITGIFVIYISVSESMKSIIALVNRGYIKVSFDSKKIESFIEEKRLLIKGPKIVVIGGGTGLSTMLRGLKYYTSNITAIVTVADDGGGSGDLREDLGMLPPGDIRNCILALADTEPIMENLLQYRFKEGKLKNQSFGNLFLAAMDGISDNFEEAVQKMSSVLAVTGKVVPVTLDNMELEATLKNGKVIRGESQIPEEAIKQNSKIRNFRIIPEDAKPLKEAIEAIREADAIVMGPGSLYTSIIPNLLVKDIAKEVRKSDALKFYISNIMTQPGETTKFKVSDHLKVLQKYGGKDIVNYVVANVGEVENELKEKYKLEDAELVKLDSEAVNNLGIKIIGYNLVKVSKGFIKHDADKLAQVLVDTIMEKKLLYDKKKIIEYMYLSQRIKERVKEEKTKSILKNL
ncbi:YvcK family protein [Clostridium botulinum]|uniref:Putative gluconeogenesis factor n=1 Tax=Clostridium botulinum (strain Eklund 17B / Type B) TaxID=935198 RepID=B2TQS0_CLOBB|nr:MULTISPECIES: YvcK family protein [unclassified Clostridium]ACD23006.1 transporter [Clostridium botulinum B str. Eklund 17B (NRP)]MBY6975703.1 YvcK family protein [Clostridium botulinum]MBY7001252.1 YvcK family protein [Clostridium botulinum]MCR1274019.1 YvcK family protein [Clostridium botulinum]NFD69218.1 YvcK family protein [Clostridium botulinum]